MIEVRKFTKKDKKIWDSFIENSNNGTIFHLQKFLSYHPKDRFNFLNLGFYKSDRLISVISGSITDNVFSSPAGASYGSFATSEDINLQEYEEVIDSFLDYCQKNKIKQIYLTLPPIIYLKKLHQIEPFLLEYKGFRVEKNLITNAVEIGNLKKDDVMDSFSSMHRRAVKKSFSSDVKTSFSDDYKSFYKILLENKKKFNALPTHTYEELITLSKLFPERIKLLMSFNKQNEPIGGILLMVVNPSCLLAFYICHLEKYQSLRPVNRMFFDSVIWGIEKKLPWLDLGVSMNTFFQNPMEPSRSLISFKEGIGTRGFLRTTYRLTL